METNMKPRILITTRVNPNEKKLKTAIYTDYIEAIYQANGTVLLFPHRINDDLDDIVAFFDGLLITGGEDVDSKYYNEPLHETAQIAYSTIDEADLILARKFKEANKPIFGICRGLQVLNVAFGGSLIQDIPSEFGGAAETHQQQLRLDNPKMAHSVDFTVTSQLHDIFGDTYQVNSYHHQAIKKLSPYFKATAYSPDGLIEAIEDGNNIFAVQWHPERLIDDDKHFALFELFIKLCLKHQK